MSSRKPPYLLYSDVHFHNWSAFATMNEDKINSRLRIQLNELGRAYDMLREEGGRLAVCAGDLFHVRGKLAPSVTNPVDEFYRAQEETGVETVILSGNHDLEGNDADEMTSAVTTIQGIGTVAISESCQVSTTPMIYMIPWRSDLRALREEIRALSDTSDPDNPWDLVIHAPMNEVLMNIPNSGLNASEFEGMNFKRVFVGHYHNHKRLADNVYSVGATTHQTWGDVGTQAGFCMVYDEEVKFISTRAPKFITIPLEASEEECAEVDGNFVRADILDPTPETILRLREHMSVTHRAAGVTVRAVISKKSSTREGDETVASIDSLTASIGKYAMKHHSDAVAEECAVIYEEAIKE